MFLFIFFSFSFQISIDIQHFSQLVFSMHWSYSFWFFVLFSPHFLFLSCCCCWCWFPCEIILFNFFTNIYSPFNCLIQGYHFRLPYEDTHSHMYTHRLCWQYYSLQRNMCRKKTRVEKEKGKKERSTFKHNFIYS